MAHIADYNNYTPYRRSCLECRDLSIHLSASSADCRVQRAISAWIIHLLGLRLLCLINPNDQPPVESELLCTFAFTVSIAAYTNNGPSTTPNPRRRRPQLQQSSEHSPQRLSQDAGRLHRHPLPTPRQRLRISLSPLDSPPEIPHLEPRRTPSPTNHVLNPHLLPPLNLPPFV